VFHVKLNARAILEQFTESQSAQLHAYVALLSERAVPMGLVSSSDVDRLWARHIEDSLRGLECMRTEDRGAVDLGSGAGLPGIPLAIALPEVRFALIEPKRRRAAFLELAVDSLELENVSVVLDSAGETSLTTDLCLARALASPAASWEMASSLLSEGGRLVYWAGRTWRGQQVDELARFGAKAEICQKPQFQWQGPLVIMSPFSTTFPEDG
jgi:16S rRNA (guanine(527)-N(7))-methyltransferase RsmG